MNFMNSPGANLLRALGTPGFGTAEDPRDGMKSLFGMRQTPAPPPIAAPPADPAAMEAGMEGANGLAYKRPDGLLKKLMSIFGGGA